MREHEPLAFVLQDRIILRTRGRAWYRAGKLVIRPRYRNDKQRRLYSDAVFGRMHSLIGAGRLWRHSLTEK